jgi:DNA-binding MarR family transcriptional regulator
MNANSHDAMLSDVLPVDAPGRRRLPILLRRAWYGMNQAFRRRIAHTGVTPDQFTVLRSLLEGDSKGLVQSELTRLMASDPNTIAALVERMEGTRLVERRVHESDRRANRIRVTAKGRRKYLLLRKVALELQSKVLEVVPEEDRQEFLEHLARISEACREAAEKSPKRKPRRPASRRPEKSS